MVRRVLSILSILLGFSILLPYRISQSSIAKAHDPHECPPGIIDIPALPGHIDQADIVNGNLDFREIIDAGQIIFEANFNRCDGQGRPASTGIGNHRNSTDQPEFIRTSGPDANSCAGCHNLPASGGGGDIVTSVFVLAQAAEPVVTILDQQFFNERHTIGMFGSGPIEMLAREMTAELHAIRDTAFAEANETNEPVRVELIAKGVHFGYITAYPHNAFDPSEIEGIDPDLIIKPFHQAGVVVSLREFTVNAMNQHHGMQAEERFDLNPHQKVDQDEDGIGHELSIGDITAITLWQAALDTPSQVLPDDPAEQTAIAQGEIIFSEVGCSVCHVPEFELDSRFFSEPNPYNPAEDEPMNQTFRDTTQSYSFDMTEQGSGMRLERSGDGALIRPFTDLKRHNLCDNPTEVDDPIRFYCNEQLDQNRPVQNNRPGREFFITRKLWDIGDSTSFGHRGDITTIYEAILYHGGEARTSRDAYIALSEDDQLAVVKFLYSLQVILIK